MLTDVNIFYYKENLEVDMFIYSIRASTIKFLALTLFLTVIVGALAISTEAGTVSAVSLATEIDYSNIKTKENRIGFMRGFGIKVDENSEEEKSFLMPENFDRVILGYNELQKKQGLDLSKYQNKKVTRFSYRVTNYKSEGDVYANIFVYRGKIVACDICSASPDGFVIPLTQVEKSNLK
jgi:hypothetical protein